MSQYLEIDADPGKQLASNTGWGDVIRYAATLPLGTADKLKHLTVYGWAQDINVLLRDIGAAIKQVPPRPDVADTLTNLLALLTAKPGAVVVAVTNGMTKDDSGSQPTATKKTPAASAGSSSVAAGGKDTSDTSNALGKGGKVSGTPGSQRSADAAEIMLSEFPEIIGRQKSIIGRENAITQWCERCCTSLIERGKPLVSTRSVFEIEPHECELMGELLPDCTTPEMVRAAFASLQKGIYLCRHAQTDANKTGNLRGWLDFPLNDQGKKDAETVGNWLRGKSVEQVRRSNLKRAKQTSRRIMAQLGVEQPYETAFWYRDWSLGLLDGRPQGDVDALIANYVTTNRDNAPDAGETFNKFLARCLPRIQNLMNVIADPDQSGSVMALVTHSSVLRAVASWLTAGAKVPAGSTDPWQVDSTTFLTLPIADSSIVWMALTPKGWVWKLIDPLGTADVMGTPR